MLESLMNLVKFSGLIFIFIISVLLFILIVAGIICIFILMLEAYKSRKEKIQNKRLKAEFNIKETKNLNNSPMANSAERNERYGIQRRISEKCKGECKS